MMYKMITHHDIILGESFDLPLFDKMVTDLELLNDYSDVINNAIYESIIILADHPEWDVVPCFLTEDVVFDIKRDSFSEQLEPCLRYYIENEDFEICAHLDRLRTILEN